MSEKILKWAFHCRFSKKILRTISERISRGVFEGTPEGVSDQISGGTFRNESQKDFWERSLEKILEDFWIYGWICKKKTLEHLKKTRMNFWSNLLENSLKISEEIPCKISEEFPAIPEQSLEKSFKYILGRFFNYLLLCTQFVDVLLGEFQKINPSSNFSKKLQKPLMQNFSKKKSSWKLWINPIWNCMKPIEDFLKKSLEKSKEFLKHWMNF